ncbi:MAG: hypothetical protein LBH49_03485 [Puniceicoccales bacterium]|nr:hypothetical protein [Puniceicoccales bacterium]
MISLLLLIYATLTGVASAYKDYVVRNRVTADLIELAVALERYKEIHGDYPRPLTNVSGEENGKILYASLKGDINPFGLSIPADPENVDPVDRKKVNLVPAKIKKICNENDMKFIDQFNQDYLYYYATRGDVNNELWQRPSFVLGSKGMDGIRTVQIGSDGTVSPDKGDDMIVGNTGML